MSTQTETRSLAHAVRTQLGAIQTAADLLDRFHERMTDAERREELDAIRAAVRRIADLLDHQTQAA